MRCNKDLSAIEKLWEFALEDKQDGAWASHLQWSHIADFWNVKASTNRQRSLNPHLQQVSTQLLTVINACKIDSTCKLGNIKMVRHAGFQRMYHSYSEKNIGLEDWLAPITDAIISLDAQVEFSKQKADDLEDRLWQNNIMIISLPKELRDRLLDPLLRMVSRTLPPVAGHQELLFYISLL